MVPIKSTKTALAVTLAVVVLATLFGSHRSLNALRKEALVIFEQGEYGDGHGVSADLERRAGTCANLCSLARSGGLDGDERVRRLARRVEEFRAGELETDLTGPAQEVIDLLENTGLPEEERKSLSGQKAQLASIQDTIRRDRYTQMAQDFNGKTLAAFPANLLHTLTGVKPLAVYR